MKYRGCTVLTYDDPPAPQELPFQLVPLSPPKRATRPSTSDSSKSLPRSRSSSPLQPSTSPKTNPEMKNTQDRSRRPSDSSQYSTSSSISQLIIDGENSYDQEPPESTDGSMSSKRLSLDNSPPTRLSVAVNDTSTPALRSFRSSTSGAHEPLSTPITAQEDLAKKGNFATTTTYTSLTTLTTPDTTISSSSTMNTDVRLSESPLEEVKPDTEEAGPGSESVVVGQYEVESDAMSLISRVLDNYCRGFEETDDEDSLSSPVGDTLMVVEKTGTTETDDEYIISSSSSKPTSAPASTSQFRHNKPRTLILTSSSSRQKEDITSSLPTLPQSAPTFRRVRPLPQPPAPQRRLRPLPRPPLPPPYSSPISSPISSSSTPFVCTAPSQASSSSSSSSSDTLPSTPSSSTSTSPLNTKVELDTLSSLPAISKRPTLPLLIPVSVSPSNGSLCPSPLPSDIPIPPSPISAKRNQASKLTRMLGAEFPAELVYKQRIITGAMAPERVTSSRTIKQRQPTSRLPSRSARPLAIYVDDISEEVEISASGSEDGNTHLDRKAVVIDRNSMIPSSNLDSESDSVPTSPTSEYSVIDEEDLDFEEAHIGWALQNVVKYEPVSRVKRTSRVWVLERNGERWEEEDYCNVLKALRQL